MGAGGNPGAGESAGGDEDWVVRPVTGAATTKAYRCPGCDQLITAGTPHRVVWPVGDIDERRHWHTPCWTRRHVSANRRRRPWRHR
ncbi:hypothetical protein MXD62_26830 [Frankia sp. Mgl5]|uniref:hypothetical protein n=1 Tax=Frankia sp. Mgl5 TaxID=2933793 RepID=UPI0020108D7E|nr:hypothetical protein [Frankia sp. Mgl5]MCK9930723.1 hypothetical protein [Frankia sp. Mgl5]